MDLYGELGISQEAVSEVKAQEVSAGFVLPVGIYNATVKEVYIRKTDKGANMLQVMFSVPVAGEATDYMYATCVKSGDEKGNKATYTDKQGKERTLPGVHEMKHFTDACQVEKPEVKAGKVKFGDSTIDALCVPGLTGVEIKIALRQEENSYNGDVNLRNDLFAFMTKDGNNSAGVNIIEDAEKLIARTPIKKLKAGKGAPAGGNGTAGNIDADAAKKSGWA